MGIATILGLVASIVVGLKNSQGQPLVGTSLANIIPAAESAVTAILADISAARTQPQTAQNIEQELLAALAAALTVLKATGGLSANTLAEITSLEQGVGEALKAYADAGTVTDPSLLVPIPHAT